MKFEIEYEDEYTSARKGILRVNNKTVDTPVLWLSHTIKDNLKPWGNFPIKTLLVNAYEIASRSSAYQSIQKNGIHRFLAYDGLVMMDSGGFLFQKKNEIDVSPDTILNLYHLAKPDIGVILDHPLNPLQSHHINYRRWKKTIDNTIFMYQNNGTCVLMPVLHGYTLRKLRNACKEVKKIDANPKIIGLGSLVPIVFRTKGMRNFANSMHFVVDAIKLVREEFPDAFLHVFGIGSTTSMHLMFSLGVDSLDSTGWRLKAAYGRIQLPGIGDRYVQEHHNGRKVISKEEEKKLSQCKCPVCRGHTLKERINILDKSFKKRALHNAWVFMEEEKMFKQSLKAGNAESFVENRLKNSPFLKGFKYSRDKNG